MITSKEYIKICERVSKETYEFMQKKITKEIKNIGKGSENEINVNIIGGLIMQSTAVLDENLLRAVKALYRKFDPASHAYIELMTMYFVQLLKSLDDDACLILQNLTRNIN